ALIGLGLAGLPLTGGALAKLAAKAPLGYGLAGAIAAWSAAGTTLLMLHFLRRVSSVSVQHSRQTAPLALVASWLILAILCLFLPWAYYSTAGLGSFSDAFAPAVVWKTLWPVLVGVGLFLGLGRWFDRIPSIPCGDIVVLGRGFAQIARVCGSAIAKVDRLLQLWTVACLALLVVILALLAAMFARS
ncbi:MAG TPA: hypothetical protein VFS35_00685, partial [Terrimicrobiaceae bacterium]|nr:hypothetical protein [Terrimicrobiaceae bacterium]